MTISSTALAPSLKRPSECAETSPKKPKIQDLLEAFVGEDDRILHAILQARPHSYRRITMLIENITEGKITTCDLDTKLFKIRRFYKIDYNDLGNIEYNFVQDNYYKKDQEIIKELNLEEIFNKIGKRSTETPEELKENLSWKHYTEELHSALHVVKFWNSAIVPIREAYHAYKACRSRIRSTEKEASEFRQQHSNLTLPPPEIENLPHLTILDLSHNKLYDLPHEIRNLVHLERLNLSHNQFLFSLPNGIGKLVNLTSIDLSNNEINTVPEDFMNLVNLTNLDLSNTHIQRLPEEFWNLVNLRVLSLENSYLYILSEKIGNLVQLRVLNLQYTSLYTLPKEIGTLVHLESLLIDHIPTLKTSTLLPLLWYRPVSTIPVIWSRAISFFNSTLK